MITIQIDLSMSLKGGRNKEIASCSQRNNLLQSLEIACMPLIGLLKRRKLPYCTEKEVI